MRKLLFILTVTILTLGVQAQMVEHLYDFNDLGTLPALDGVDGWTTVVNQAHCNIPENDFWKVGEISYWNVLSPDGSLFMHYDGGGSNVGRTASRLSSDSLPFDFSIGGIIEIEVDIFHGWWKTYFGFNYDKNDDGITLKGIENTLIFQEEEGGVGLHFSSQNHQYNAFVKPDGTHIHLGLDKDSLLYHWYSYKMTIDFDAYDGQGSVSIFYIQDVIGNWVSCPDVTNINLGLTPGSGDIYDPAMWSKLIIHGTAHSNIDNIITRQPETGGLLYQYLIFDPVPDHLSTDPPFTVHASSNMSLTPTYAVGSGPATISGDVVTLTGEPGVVTVVASQAGNDTVAPAADEIVTFDVIDPMTVIPEMDIKNAVEGEVVMMPELMAMPFVVSTEIEYSHLLHIQSVKFEINGETIYGIETSNGFFMGNWTPPDYGTYLVDVTTTSSGGVSVSESVSFEVVADAPSIDYVIIDDFVFAGSNSIDTTLVFPSFAGTYSSVTAILNYGTPCDPWDGVSRVQIRGANGNWMELFKYITPYGVACDDEIDITDFVSQLQGKVDIKINFSKAVVSITLHYEAGTPEHPYSWMDVLWYNTYPFGMYGNLHPIPIRTLNFSPEIEKAHVRLLCSGHAWGSSNTGNAAEFYEATHNININGNTEYQQHLWQTCNPNPVGCQPQNGTWYYNRAGWCPGSIPILYQYDLTPWITIPDLELEYEFYQGYMDYCSAYHPDCVSGVTCSDCFYMWNPEILVAGELVTFSNSIITSVKDKIPLVDLQISIQPNPSNGMFTISTSEKKEFETADVRISSLSGNVIKEFIWTGETINIDLTSLAKGVYLMTVSTNKGVRSEKLIIQ